MGVHLKIGLLSFAEWNELTKISVRGLVSGATRTNPSWEATRWAPDLIMKFCSVHVNPIEERLLKDKGRRLTLQEEHNWQLLFLIVARGEVNGKLHATVHRRAWRKQFRPHKQWAYLSCLKTFCRPSKHFADETSSRDMALELFKKGALFKEVEIQSNLIGG